MTYVIHNYKRLIKHTAQDPSDDYQMVTYSSKLTHVLFIGVMILGALGLTFSYTGLQAYDQDSVYNANPNTKVNLLTANIGVMIPDAIGGPADIIIEDAALVSQTAISTNGIVKPVIEDTNGISFYIVQEGDTLSEIAELFDVTTNTIRWENNLGKTLKIGQELKILPVTGVTHTIKKGDTYGKIAKTYDVETEDITVFNNLDATSLKIGAKIIVPNGIKRSVTTTRSVSTGSKASRSSAQSGFYIRPTTGRTSSTFGPRSGSYHYGIDFAVPIGTPVVASASGTVTRTSCGSGYGICTIIKHDNGTQTLYAHNSTLFVSVGSKVRQGQKIANSGNTGRSTGPHLHFEIQDTRSGAKKNPNFLK